MQNKAGDYALRNDYLDSKVLELEDRLKHQRRLLSEFHEKEKEKAFSKLYLKTHCEMVE